MPVPDLYFWGIRVGNKMVSKFHAHVQVSLASPIPEDCLAFDIRFLVDVQLVLHQST